MKNLYREILRLIAGLLTGRRKADSPVVVTNPKTTRLPRMETAQSPVGGSDLCQIRSYHPFRLWMDNLPEWDGEDRVCPLARRVSTDELWVDGFCRWMLGLSAQWMGLDELHANSVAPVLISRRQE